MKFQRNVVAFCAIVLLTIFVTACQRNDNSVQAAREEKATNDSAVNSADKNALSPEDRDTAFKIEQANIEEMDLARYVRDKTTNGDVKSYTSMLIDDHNDALNKIQDLLKDKNVNESATSKPQNEASKMSMLQNASGADLDREYLRMMVQDHQKTLEELRGAESSVQNPDLKDYIHDLIPTVQKHLEKAQDLENKLNPPKTR